MGGGKSAPINDALAGLSKEAFNLGKPAMQQALDVFRNTLATGKFEARTPQINQAVESSMAASGQAQRTMAEDLSRAGMAGTPYAMSILGPMQQQAAQQAAYIPTQMRTEDFWKVLSLFFPGAGQSMQTGIGGLGSASQAEAQANAAKMAMMGQMFSAPFQSIQGYGKLF